MERREAEIVEQVVAVLEFGELGATDEEHHRSGRVGVFAHRPQERPGAFGIGRGVDDRAGPPALRFALGHGRTGGDGLPAVAGEVERARQIGRRGVGDHDQHLSDGDRHQSAVR